VLRIRGAGVATFDYRLRFYAVLSIDEPRFPLRWTIDPRLPAGVYLATFGAASHAARGGRVIVVR
jgi:hypothetical protein